MNKSTRKSKIILMISPLHTGDDMVHDKGRPDPDPVCPGKSREETEPGHQEIECQQEQHGGDYKPECRDDKLPGCLPPCLRPCEKKSEGSDHRRCSEYAAIPGIHLLGKQSDPDNDTSTDYEFQECVEVVHRVEYFPRRLNTLTRIAPGRDRNRQL